MRNERNDELFVNCIGLEKTDISRRKFHGWEGVFVGSLYGDSRTIWFTQSTVASDEDFGSIDEPVCDGGGNSGI
jgi:hypothetical protein